MKKLNGESMDIVNENIEKLKEIFPEIFSEGKIVCEKLEEELGQFIDKENERYNFTWNGKQAAKKIAQTPSTGTLRPSKEESKDWDTTENLYIEGDNLEVLKLLQKSYHKQVKMIYIDPPYNTGKDFVYKDNFKDNIHNYLEQTGQVDSDGNRLSTNSDTSGRYHSDWLSMMYPRLKLARNLLKDDGVIFISIDDNEFSNLRKICDEIFGEDNFIADLIWANKEGGGGSDSSFFRIKHEHILCFSKNKNLATIYGEEQTEDESYSFSDEYIEERGKYKLIKLNSFSIQYSESLDYPIKLPNDDIITPMENGRKGCWRWSEKKLKWGIENKFIEFKKNTSGQLWVYTKQYFKVDNENKKIIRSVPYRGIIEKFSSTQATKQLDGLFGKKIFDYSKPVALIKLLLQMTVKNEELILDFFSGSATTAHSILELNSEDNISRKFIMVQLPEVIENSEYETICKVGQERIRRAGEKIKADNPDKDLSNLDIGFKVFKLDSSNIKEWDSDFENLEANLLDSVENIKEDRSNEDLLYEILLKYGLDLTLPIEELLIENKKVYSIGFGALIVCIEDDITIDTVKGIAKYIEENVVYDEEKQKRHSRVVFKDSSFKNAVVKTNAIQVLEQSGIDEVVSV